MKRLLITGGSGFLGGHLITQAREKYHVTATYFRQRYPISSVRWEYFDLTAIDRIESFIEAVYPDAIIHNAAMTLVDECEQKSDQAFLTNVMATAEIARIAKRRSIRLIYVSSDMVFDGKKGNYREDDDVNPVNYYGKTKVLAEESIKSVCKDYVIARSALIYGGAITSSNSFVEKTLHHIRKGQPINLFYDQYRSPILVDNLAEALVELAEHPFIGTIHLGGSERLNRYDFGLIMADIFHFSITLLNCCSMYDFVTPAKRPQDVSLNISRARDILITKFLNCKEGLRLSAAKLS